VPSREADADIEDIAKILLQDWDIRRAERYVMDLRATFQRPAEFPDQGRRHALSLPVSNRISRPSFQYSTVKIFKLDKDPAKI
jgi:plasmid stabilization system protein ParE